VLQKSLIYDYFAIIYTENNIIRILHILPTCVYQLTLRRR